MNRITNTIRTFLFALSTRIKSIIRLIQKFFRLKGQKNFYNEFIILLVIIRELDTRFQSKLNIGWIRKISLFFCTFKKIIIFFKDWISFFG